MGAAVVWRFCGKFYLDVTQSNIIIFLAFCILLASLPLRVKKRSLVVMMKQKSVTIFVCFFFFIIVFFSISQAAVKGSETAVSVEPAYTFPSADTDNTLLGFGWFKNGFTLEDSLTTATFNCVFPVSGGVNLNGGTLYLLSDLTFSNTTELQGLGTIIGNDHMMQLCQNNMTFPADDHLYENTHLFLGNNVMLSSTATFRGSGCINGMGYDLALDTNGEIVVDSNSELWLKNLRIRGLSGANIRCVDDTAKLILQDVDYRISDNYQFPFGSIEFWDTVNFIGTGTFAYESNQTSTIFDSSTLGIADGLNFQLGRGPISGNNPFAFENATSVLKLDNCRFNVTALGTQFTKGTVSLSRNIIFDMASSTTTTGIILGDGTLANDFGIYFAPSAVVDFVQGMFVYNNASPNALESTSNSARLIRTLGSNTYVAQDITFPELTVQLRSNLIAPIQVAPGKFITFQDTRIQLPDADYDISAKQLNFFTYSLSGNQYIFLNRGSLPFYMTVSSTGNTVRGNGSLTGIVTLADSSTQLNCGITGEIGNTLILNSGTINLTTDLKLNEAGIITGPGTVNLGSHVLSLSKTAMTWNSPTSFIGTTGTIDLYARLDLTQTWTINGTVVIEGNGNTLDLRNGGNIVVAANSQVQFKNVRVLGVNGTNIKCLDDNGRVILINANFEQAGDYLFDTGSMTFVRDNAISGPYRFTYDSSQTSTIRVSSSLVLGGGLTLDIGRTSSTSSNEPLSFDGSSANLEFDNANWTVRSTGMRVTTGTVSATRDNVIDVLSTSTTNGLIFGNSTVPGDVKIMMNPGCTARFVGGHVTLDVIASDVLASKSKTAQIFRSNTSTFYLKNNLTLANITLNINPLSTLLIDAGKFLDYLDSRIIFTEGTFDLTGTRYSGTTSLLGGNDFISMNLGVLPLATLVQSSNNKIGGGGNITGPIIMSNSSSQLICELNGFIMTNVIMGGGTLTLSSDLWLGNDVQLLGTGTVQLASNNIEFGLTDLSWTGTTRWDANNGGGSVNLHANLILSGSWTFTGNAEIKGRGNTLDLGQVGQIIVEGGSTLTIRDTQLKGMAGDNIRCADDTARIIFDNVIWNQYTSNYLFDTGALQILNRVSMIGTGIFTYQSTQTSTIAANSQLKLDNGFTFSYNPAAGSNLIEFTDNTSILMLDGGNVHAGATGMDLTKGKMIVKNHSSLYSETVDNGINLGASDSAQDFTVVILSDIHLSVLSGALNYKNISSDAWQMATPTSFLEMASLTSLNIYETLNLGTGQVIFGDQSTLGRQDGDDLIGSIVPLGDLFMVNLP
jgi:hypothetical protein